MELRSIEPFLQYYASVRRRTRALAECIPEDRLEWRPAEGRFSPGDLLRHIAGAERWMWAENAALRPSRYPGHGPELAAGRDAVLDYFDTLHEETLAILGALGPDDLQKRCTTVAGADLRVWKWLRLLAEHEIHHRGQLYEILGQAGVETPSLYGLTESQVLERAES